MKIPLNALRDLVSSEEEFADALEGRVMSSGQFRQMTLCGPFEFIGETIIATVYIDRVHYGQAFVYLTDEVEIDLIDLIGIND